MQHDDTLNITPIGHIETAYKQKFGIPRQPGLATSVTAKVRLLPGFDSMDMVRGLDQTTHIWLMFVFSECVNQGWKPLVRPPRLGGNKKLGVLATRSPFRPNPIGLSVVKLLEIIEENGKCALIVEGADLLDGTPIVDIKPYLPYCDSIDDASYPLTDPKITLDLPVIFSEQARLFCESFERQRKIALYQQICEILKCDPRPAYKRNTDEKTYGIKLYNLDIYWRIDTVAIYVDKVKEL